MNFFSVRTNDQNTIGQILNKNVCLVFDRLSWHKDDISIGDIVFIVISGDNSKKVHSYENGLRAIAMVSKLPEDEVSEKHFKIEVEIFEFLPKSLLKEDFYFYPLLKDAPNIGPETKQTPNQAFRKIDTLTGKSIIRALFDILPNKLQKSKYDSIVDNDYNINKLSLVTNNDVDVKKNFYYFLKAKVSRESTIKQYFSWMIKVQNWFIEKNIVNNDFNIWRDVHKINDIQNYLNNESFSSWKATNKPIKNWMSSPWNAWVEFNNNKDIVLNENIDFNSSLPFDLPSFIESVAESGLVFSDKLIIRFVSSLLTKPFVLLTGLSGSGKTKIAQSFAQWICEDESQYLLIPVGADWTNREPLLGYPNGLNPEEYITPDSGTLNLIIEAAKIENADKPYFLILDEMNLSHVERYFADFLSVMESNDKISLYTGAQRKDLKKNDIPSDIFLPKNLFIIGTVNIDETTYMFSPKVLDRANTIEFRVDESNIRSFFELPSKIDLSVLSGKGALMAKSFLDISQDKSIEIDNAYTDIFIKFFNELKKIGAEFGYRTAIEMLILIKKLSFVSSMSVNECIDIAVMQKLLPKLHGSRNKISKVLDALILLCLKNGQTFTISKSEDILPENILYPISYEKLVRMYKNAIDNGFTSYAEA